MAQCASAPAWTQVGPAPIEINNDLLAPPSIATNSGIVKAITLYPTNPGIIYIGGRGSGLWTTTTGGGQWFTLTDNLPAPNKTSLQIETIVVDGSILLAGTGVGPALNDGAMDTELVRSIGALRNTDAGLLQAPYEQVGPTMCTAAAGDTSCRNAVGACIKSDPVACPGTIPTDSMVTVRQLSIDKSTGTTRIWAATSKGLWWSDTALSAGTPAGVIWTAVTPPGSCASNCLPSAGGTPPAPAPVNNILVSPLRDSGTNAFILYASVHGAQVATNNGWYRSVNRGAAWTKVGNTCSNCTVSNPGGCASCLPATTISKAVIWPGAAPGNPDTIYAMMKDVPTSCNGVVAGASRIYRSINSGTSWSLIDLSLGSAQACEGAACNYELNCDGPLSVQVHPTDANRIVVGSIRLYEATSVGMVQQTVRRIGYGILHDDHNALTYHPTDSSILYDGSDGGIWSIAMNASPTAFTFRHGSNLANVEFYGGAGGISTLNYGASFGGTQDNGDMKAGSGPTVWRGVLGGDGGVILIDPKDSNVEYHNFTSKVRKTVNGGIHAEITDHISGLPIDPATNGVIVRPLTMDPVDNKSLVISSLASTDRRIYRTTTGAEQSAPPAPAWVPIMSPTVNLDVRSLAIAPAVAPNPRSDLIYAGTYGSGLYRTANASNWQQFDLPAQIPHQRVLGSLAIDTSTNCPAGQQLCSAGCACTIYAAFGEPAAAGEIPGSVFRSTDSGSNWQQISGNCDTTHPCPGGGCPATQACAGGLPAVAANRIVIAPDNPDRVYVATDMGLYQGTRSGSTWTWCSYSNGFPKTAIVNDLAVHRESGLLRAFTYGRSVWDVTAFTAGNPDYKANAATPATDALAPRISSTNSGSLYAVAWSDDRPGSGGQHLYLRGYQYGGNGQPLALSAGDVRVDDNLSAHVPQWPAVAANPTLTTPPFCGRLAWQDDRQGSNTQHIYFQYACSDGYRLYTSDQQADTATARATNAAIVALDNGWFSIVWQAERGGPTLHDVYVRIFNAFGGAVTTAIKVNTSSADATLPAVTTDSANNTYVAWQEGAASIMARRYDANGNPFGSPQPVATAVGGVVRQTVALADPRPANPANVFVTWSESVNGGAEQVVARTCTTTLTSCITVVDGQCDRRCAGGSNNNATCGVDSECPGSTCTKTLATVSCPPLEPP